MMTMFKNSKWYEAQDEVPMAWNYLAQSACHKKDVHIVHQPGMHAKPCMGKINNDDANNLPSTLR